MVKEQKKTAPAIQIQVGAVTFLEMGRLIHELAKTPKNRKQALLDKIHFHHLLLAEFLRSSNARTRPFRNLLDYERSGVCPAKIRVFCLALYRTLCVPKRDLSITGLASSCVPESEDLGGILASREAIRDLIRLRTLVAQELSDREICVDLRPELAERLFHRDLAQPIFDNQLVQPIPENDPTRRPLSNSPIDFSAIPMPIDLLARISQKAIGLDALAKSMASSLTLHIQRAKMLLSGADPRSCGRNQFLALLGPSGCGKTHMLTVAAQILGLPHTIWDSTNLTVDGFVGLGVSDMIESLVASAGSKPEKSRFGLCCLDEFDSKLVGKDCYGIATGGIQKSILKLAEGMDDFVVGGRKASWHHKSSFNSHGTFFAIAGAFPEVTAELTKRLGKTSSLGFSSEVNGPSRSSVVLGDILIQCGLIPELVNRLTKILIFPEPNVSQLIQIASAPHGVIQNFNQILKPLDMALEFDAGAIVEMAEYGIETKKFTRGMQAIASAIVEELVFQEAAGTYSVDRDWIRSVIRELDEGVERLAGIQSRQVFAASPPELQAGALSA